MPPGDASSARPPSKANRTGMIPMRLIILGVTLAALATAFPAAAQQGTLRIVLGFPAGATADVLSRLLAEHMRASLGQPVIVENKPGAGGRIGNETVKAAAPD